MAAKSGDSSAQVMPHYTWHKVGRGYRPVIHVGAIDIPMDVRPYRQFLQFERDYILMSVRAAVAEAMFGEPDILVNAKTFATAPNPKWAALPYLEQTEDGKLVEIEPQLDIDPAAIEGNVKP